MSDEAKRILIIYNPKAGKGKIKGLMPKVKKMFYEAGLTPEFHATKCRGDAYDTARDYIKKHEKMIYSEEELKVMDSKVSEDYPAESKYRVYIIAAGGDGTLNEVMRGVLSTGKKVPIGIIPAGSTNDFGYSLGINGGLEDAARKALDAILDESVFECDSALFNGEYFTYTSAFGLFSDVSYATPQKLKNTLGHLAYIVYGAKTLPKTRKIKAKIVFSTERCNGEESDVSLNAAGTRCVNGDFLLGMVVSAKSVGGFRGITGEGVALDDGMHELMFVKWPKGPVRLFKTIAHAIGMVTKNPRALAAASDLSKDYGIKIIRVSKAEFKFTEPVCWSIDGEDGGGKKKVVIDVKKRAVLYLAV